MALKPLAEAKQILLFANVSHPDVTTRTKYVLRHSNIIETDATTLANAIKASGNKRIGIIYQHDDWGMALASALEKHLTHYGLSTLAQVHLPDLADARIQLLKLDLKQQEAIVVISLGALVGQNIKNLRELGFKGQIYTSIAFILSPETSITAGKFANGIHYQAIEPNYIFNRSYKHRFSSTPPLFGQVTHTDLELLQAAAKASSSLEPLTLIRYIKNMQRFTGIFETIDILPTGDIPIKTIIKVFQTDTQGSSLQTP